MKPIRHICLAAAVLSLACGPLSAAVAPPAPQAHAEPSLPSPPPNSPICARGASNRTTRHWKATVTRRAPRSSGSNATSRNSRGMRRPVRTSEAPMR